MDKKVSSATHEYGTSALKGVVGGVPWIGTLLNEIMFEARARIKQARVNQFIQDFQKYIDENLIDISSQGEIDPDNFGDTFEAILRNVSRTSAPHKLLIFRNILLKQLSPLRIEEDVARQYAQIINEVSSLQFRILCEFNRFNDNQLRTKVQLLEMQNVLNMTRQMLAIEERIAKRGYENNIELFEKRIRYIETLSSKKRRWLSNHPNLNNAGYYNLGHQEFIIEIQGLISKGLMYDLALSTEAVRVNEFFSITKLGRSLVDFVGNDNETTSHEKESTAVKQSPSEKDRLL